MKEQLKAKQASFKLKQELNKPKLTRIKRVYLTEKIELLEEFINGKSK